MVIVEKRYKGSEHVWRTLFVGFASRWGDPMDDVPAGSKYDGVQRVSTRFGNTTEKEATAYVWPFRMDCEFCRVVSVDSEPHADWTPIA